MTGFIGFGTIVPFVLTVTLFDLLASDSFNCFIASENDVLSPIVDGVRDVGAGGRTGVGCTTGDAFVEEATKLR